MIGRLKELAILCGLILLAVVAASALIRVCDWCVPVEKSKYADPDYWK